MSKVLITGTSKGLGRSLANELTKRNYQVIASARNISDINDLDVYKKISLDVTDVASIQSAKEESGEIDILINNAAYSVKGVVEATPVEEYKKAIETNVVGPLSLIKSFLPGMRGKKSGVIVNISSVSDRFAYPEGWVYASTKGALALMSEALNFEVKHFGIKIILIEAGAIKTDMPLKQKLYSMPEYQLLDEQLQMRFEQYQKADNRTLPDDVAGVIVDAIENPHTGLKVAIGKDAEYMLSLHTKLSNEEWENGPLFKGLKW